MKHIQVTNNRGTFPNRNKLFAAAPKGETCTCSPAVPSSAPSFLTRNRGCAQAQAGGEQGSRWGSDFKHQPLQGLLAFASSHSNQNPSASFSCFLLGNCSRLFTELLHCKMFFDISNETFVCKISHSDRFFESIWQCHGNKSATGTKRDLYDSYL